MFFAYKVEDLMALNLDTPLKFCKILFEIAVLSIYILLKKNKMLNNKFSMKNKKLSFIPLILMHGGELI